MSEQLTQLRERLIGASARDYPRCLDLYEAVNAYTKGVKRATREWMEASELSRRTERLFAQAVSAAQNRGEIRVSGQSRSHLKLMDVPYPDRLALIRQFESVSDDVFELAIKNAKARGSLGRTVLVEEVEALVPKADPAPPKAQRLGTSRGKRTVEHMAIQINAIAMGVGDIEPEEVPPEMAEVVRGVFRDIGTIRSFLRKVNDNG